MRSLDYVAALSLFNDVGVLASTVVSVCAAITAVAARVHVVRSKRRKERARQLSICWQVGTQPEETGALAFNESESSFREIVMTVTCGPHGRQARHDVALLRSGQDFLWRSDAVHDSIRSRSAGRPVDPPAGTPHDRKQHNVQVTYRDGKEYWFRDDKQVRRVRSLVMWAEKTRAVTLSRYFGQGSPFRRAYPVSVEVQPFERTEELEHAFMNLAATGDRPSGYKIPDVVVGPHDWIGRVAHEESVVEPPFDPAWEERISPVAIDALSRNGQLYAIPYVFDSVALIRNNRLTGASPMPQTLAEAAKIGAEAVRAKGIGDGVKLALQVGAPDAKGNAGDPYHLWPLFSSLGGSFFGFRGTVGEGVDRFDDISVWRQDFVDAFARLAEFGSGPGGNGTLRSVLTRAEALNLFLEGRAPFLVCSSRALASIRERRLDVTVSAVPPAGESAARPMVSVYGLYIYRGAPNLPAARDLVTSYISQPRAGLDLNRIQQLVPVQEEAMSEVAGRDPILRPYVGQCRGGLIMPSWPEMREAWNLIGRTEYRVLAGDGDPRALAEAAADEGWRLLAQARATGS